MDVTDVLWLDGAR